MTTVPSNPPHSTTDLSVEDRTPDAIECPYERIAGTLAGSDVCGWEWDLVTGTVFRTSLPAGLGYQPGEVETSGAAWAALVHPDDLVAARHRLDDLIHGRGARTIELEYRVRARDGSWRWMLDRAQITQRNRSGVATRLAGVGIDITAYHEARSGREHHERRYLDLVRQSRVIGWEFDRTTRCFTWVSPNASDVLGFSIEEWRQPGFWAARLHPDDSEAAKAFTRARSDEGLDHEFEYRMIAADGRVLWIRDLSTVVFDEGRPSRLRGVFIDVTDRRRAEDAVHETAEHLRAIAEHIPGVVFMYDVRPGEPRRLIYLGPGLEEIVGPARAAAVRQRYDLIFEFLHPDDRRTLKAAADRSSETLGKLDIEMRFMHEDGSPRWVRSVARPTPRHDGFERWHGVMIDITSRKQAEQTLRERDRMVDTLLGNLPGIAYRCRNTPGRPMDFMSDGCLELLGLSQHNLTDRRVNYGFEIIHPDDRGGVWDAIQEAIGERQPFQLVYRVRNARGEVRWVWEQGQAIIGPHGQVDALEGFITDVTERKIAEDRVRASESRLQLLVNQLPAMLWSIDDSLRITSSTGSGLTRIGLMPNELVGMLLTDYLGSSSEANEAMQRHRQALGGVASEYTLRWAGRVLDCRVEPMRNDDGEVVGAIGLAHDVTERHTIAEEQSRNAARIKLLLGELDHRVRNNLSSLIALVDLARRSTTDVNRFADAIIGRIHTMAAVHAHLSQSGGSSVSLRHLVYSVVPEEFRSAVTWQGDDVLVPPRPTESLPMIIHELVTNSVKHGALRTPTGQVSIACHAPPGRDRSTDVELIWRESGGPHLASSPEPGVGTSLIEGLTRTDLRGEVEMTYPAHGALHRLRFTLVNEPRATA